MAEEALRDMLSLQRQPNDNATVLNYLSHLVKQPLDVLRSSQPQQLAQSSHSLLLSIQGVSKRSHKSIVDSATRHALLRRELLSLAQKVTEIGEAVPLLDTQAERFSTNFGKASESWTATRRKRSLRLLQNSERLIDVMELPPLVAPTVRSSPISHTSGLELYTHIRRLASLYPASSLLADVLDDANAAVRHMAADLITSLEAPTLKLASALRTIGWLKRIVPNLVFDVHPENTMPALFLVCRLATLLSTLAALDPLRELADEELRRQDSSSQIWSGGQQTERFLKRFIEIFREHSFSIVSVCRSICASFPSRSHLTDDILGHLPSALSTFPLHIVTMLLETLRRYLPAVKDQTSRESILTQVLYCAGSLGRLGADFGMLLAVIGVSEWVELVKRHRLLSGRLESVIGDYRGHNQQARVRQG